MISIMSKICLVRHGETEWNRLGRLQGQTDVVLNETGKIQAKAVGEYLKQYEWSYVYSSPLRRANETARIIAKAIGLSVIKTDKAFMERNYGKAEGMTPEERTALFPDRKYPGQEDWYALRKRVHNSVLKFANMHFDENIIIVSHGAAINSILYTLSDGEYGSGITKLQSACINMLDFNGEMLKIEFYNRSI